MLFVIYAYFMLNKNLTKKMLDSSDYCPKKYHILPAKDSIQEKLFEELSLKYLMYARCVTT